MRKLLVTAALVAALAAGVAIAGAYTLPDLRLGRGYVGPVLLDVTWADGSARPVASVTGTVRVYTPAGSLLWTKPVSPIGSPANRMAFRVAATETGAVGTFFLELDLVEAGVTDALHGRVIVEGLNR